MTDLLKPELALDTRAGWPADLRCLIEQYPRDCWRAHANLGDMAQFWLARHDMFREIGTALTDATSAFREGRMTAQDFRTFFPPRLQFFLQQLNSHHQVEDRHYFPIFQAAESRLAHGFDVLEADHDVIHAQIAATVDAANAFLRTPVNDAAFGAAGDSYTATGDALLHLLRRHLADEEDLVVPLILDRGEPTLGIG